jgi:hypothetical protein
LKRFAALPNTYALFRVAPLPLTSPGLLMEDKSLIQCQDTYLSGLIGLWPTFIAWRLEVWIAQHVSQLTITMSYWACFADRYPSSPAHLVTVFRFIVVSRERFVLQAQQCYSGLTTMPLSGGCPRIAKFSDLTCIAFGIVRIRIYRQHPAR